MDTGSPGSFISQTTAEQLINKLGKHTKEGNPTGRISMFQQEQDKNTRNHPNRHYIRNKFRNRMRHTSGTTQNSEPARQRHPPKTRHTTRPNTKR